MMKKRGFLKLKKEKEQLRILCQVLASKTSVKQLHKSMTDIIVYVYIVYVYDHAIACLNTVHSIRKMFFIFMAHKDIL